MDFASLILLVLKASIALIILSIGLRAGFRDATLFFTRPWRLAKAGFAMFVVMPLAAVALIKGLDPVPPTGLMLVALSLSPVPPLVPNQGLKAGSDLAQAVGALIGASLLSVLLIPFGMGLIGSWFGLDVQIPIGVAFETVVPSILLPLFVGVLLKTVAGGLADRLAEPVGKLGSILLLAAAIPILIRTGPAIVQVMGGGTLLAFVLFAAIGVIAGHLLGSDDPGFQAVVASASAGRHPAVAASLAIALRPEASEILPQALLYLLVSIAVSSVYLSRRKTPDEEVDSAATA